MKVCNIVYQMSVMEMGFSCSPSAYNCFPKAYRTDVSSKLIQSEHFADHLTDRGERFMAQGWSPRHLMEPFTSNPTRPNVVFLPIPQLTPLGLPIHSETHTQR